MKLGLKSASGRGPHFSGGFFPAVFGLHSPFDDKVLSASGPGAKRRDRHQLFICSGARETERGEIGEREAPREAIANTQRTLIHFLKGAREKENRPQSVESRCTFVVFKAASERSESNYGACGLGFFFFWRWRNATQTGTRLRMLGVGADEESAQTESVPQRKGNTGFKTELSDESKRLH